MTNTEKTHIFFDMDGTLAVFNKLKTFEDLLQPGYFKSLLPFQTVVNAVKLLLQDENFEVFILSAYLTESKTALQEKQEWLNNYLPEIDVHHRIFVPCGEKKSDYIPTPRETDILVDDYTKNLRAWHGVAVKILNGINNNTNKWEGPMVYNWDFSEAIADAIREISDVKTTKQAMG